LLLGALLFSTHSRADWVNSLSSGMPADAIVGGQLATGATAYLCRAYHNNDLQPGWMVKGDASCHFSYGGQELTSTNFDWWIPSWRLMTGQAFPSIPFRGENANWRYPCRVGAALGKYGVDLGGCFYPFGGAEHVQAAYGFEVLVDLDGGNIDNTITPTSTMYSDDEEGPFLTEYVSPNSPFPVDAIVGGADIGGQPLYICSADMGDGYQPGKARRDWNACDVSFGGLENYKSAFFVLVPNWINLNLNEEGTSVTCGAYIEGSCWEILHPIAVGKDTDGEVLYACQVRLYPGPGVYPGKIAASFGGGCSYAMNGVENYSSDFNLLSDGDTDTAPPPYGP
jgi:hypothetical protein